MDISERTQASMTPALVPATFAGTLFHGIAPVASGISDPTIVLELAIGAAEIAVAIGIAVWQHFATKRNRRIDREREAELLRVEQEKEAERVQTERDEEARRVAEERCLQARRAEQQRIRPICEDLRSVLNTLVDKESEVREQGPLAHDLIETPRLRTLQRRLKDLSESLPESAEAFRAAVQDLTAAISKFCDIDIPTDCQVTDEYAKKLADASAGQPTPLIQAAAIASKGIAQYKAAVAMHDAIRKVRKIIEDELALVIQRPRRRVRSDKDVGASRHPLAMFRFAGDACTSPALA